MIINGLIETTRQVEIAVVGRIDQGILICLHLIGDFQLALLCQGIGNPDFQITRKTASSVSPLCIKGKSVITDFLYFKNRTIPAAGATMVAVWAIIGL